MKLLKNWREDWQIVVVLLLALFLRLPLLSGSFWLDEAAQALESARPLSQQLMIRDDFQPPLMHLLVHVELIFSKSEWWLRLGGALIPGLVTILASYLIGKKLLNKQAGLIASLLLATSSFHIFYSQELRPYSLPAMFGALSTLVLIHLLHTDHEAKSHQKSFVSFLVLSVGGLYASYLYPFLLITQFLYVLVFSGKMRKHFLLTFMGVGLAFLPWMPSFLDQLQAGQSLRQDLPGWQEVVSFNQVKAILLILGKFTFGVIDLDVNFIFLVVMVFIAVTFGFIFFKLDQKFTRTELKRYILLLCWVALPIFLAWLVSFFVPLLQPKRVLYCLPAFYLVMSWMIYKGFHTQERIVKNAAVTLFLTFLFINIYSSMSYFSMPKYQREDWRLAHQIITTKYSSVRSIAVFAFPAPFAPWQWYDEGKFPAYSTGLLTTEAEAELPNSKQLTQYQYILVFDYLRDLTDPNDKILDQLAAYGYQEVDRIDPVTPLGFVRVYAKPENVIGLK